LENTDHNHNEPPTKGERPAQHVATYESGFTTVKENFIQGVARKVYYRNESGSEQVNWFDFYFRFVCHAGFVFTTETFAARFKL
jgi:hypothetical protein